MENEQAKAWTRICRETDPAETLARMIPFVREIGVSRIADISGLDFIGLPVAVAYRPTARSLATCYGKGVTLTEAKASAVMEALERYCAENPKITLRYASYDELLGEGRVVDLDMLPRIGEAPPLKSRRSLWARAKGMTTGDTAWVPFETVHLDYALPLPTNLECLLVGSGGLASGNTIREAAVHAISELIERDALTLWRAKGSDINETIIDLESVNDPWCTEILSTLSRSGVRTAVWDMTSDLGVPAFFCEISSDNSSTFRNVSPAAGSACHPLSGIALGKAVLEAVQSRLTMISGTRDDLTREMFMRGSPRPPREEPNTCAGKAFTDIPSALDFASIDDALENLLNRLRTGIGEPLIVDLSHDGIPAVVVRVIAPGLEGSCDAPGYTAGTRARGLAAKQDGDVEHG